MRSRPRTARRREPVQPHHLRGAVSRACQPDPCSSITVDYEHELAHVDEYGHRPFRIVASDDPGLGLMSDRDGTCMRKHFATTLDIESS